MAIPVKGEADRGVAGTYGDLFGMGACGDPEGNRGVPEIMRPQVAHSGGLGGRDPKASAPDVQSNWATPGSGEDEILWASGSCASERKTRDTNGYWRSMDLSPELGIPW